MPLRGSILGAQFHETHAMLLGHLHTVFGWTIRVGTDANPRSLRNFPCQANGAEMLRLACCLATERGISIVAPVHDAVMVEGPVDLLDRIAAETQAAMAEASATILDGFRLRSDAKIVRWPDRYMDDRGREFWGRVIELIGEGRETHPESNGEGSSARLRALRTRAELSPPPVQKWPGIRAELSPLSNSYSYVFSLKRHMGRNFSPDEEVWDPDRFRLPAELIGDVGTRKRPPRHRSGESFIKGPIPYPWLASACRLPGSGLHVAMACRFLCCRYRQPNRWGLEAIARGLRISKRSAQRGLHAAELAGLLAVVREPGCKLTVSVLDIPGRKPGPGHRPLYGPSPWNWWLPASRLPGKSL